jgi:hypothetical protein
MNKAAEIADGSPRTKLFAGVIWLMNNGIKLTLQEPMPRNKMQQVCAIYLNGFFNHKKLIIILNNILVLINKEKTLPGRESLQRCSAESL